MPKKTISKAYNPEVDFWKFIFAVFIALFHSRKMLPGYIYFSRGYILVDFFFMVSGYFLAVKVRSGLEKDIKTPTSEFLSHKIKSLYKVCFAAFLIAFFGREIVEGMTAKEMTNDFVLSFFENSFTRPFGLTVGKYYNGPTWYISAMLVAMAMIYPLAVKFKRPFMRAACPIISGFCYGYIFKTVGYLNVAETTTLSFVQYSLIRAFAGLCLGCFINECCAVLKEKTAGFSVTKAGNAVFAVLEFTFLSWIIAFAVVSERMRWPRKYDFFMVIVVAAFCFIVFSELTGIKEKLSGKDFGILSKLSLYLYLNHRVITRIILKYMSDKPYYIVFPCYIGFIICSMLLCRLLVFLFDLFSKHVAPKLKNLMFKALPDEA
ncbi:MAG: acyltransferase family protein [Clostridiales bacterium]|nr:acyltransferase family protein [Clostridiales bacterium]